VFSTTDLSVEDGLILLKKIDAHGNYGLPLNYLGASLVGPSFCLMFGGGFLDALCALFAVTATYSVSLLIERLRFDNFIRIFISCAFASGLALILSGLHFISHIDPVIIGAVTIFLPGVAITNSARDLLSGEMLAGMARGTEAIISAIAIASGVGSILQLWQVAGGIL